MRTLHDNDAGYVSFYEDVIDEIERIRNDYSISDHFTSKFIVEQYEFWVEESFYDPEFDDDSLATNTAHNIASLFESSELNLF